MSTGFIGIGSMGGMLVRALVRSGALVTRDVYVANRSRARLDAIATSFPTVQVVSSSELVAACNLIFISTAAKDLASVLTQIEAEVTPDKLLVLTSASVSLNRLELSSCETDSFDHSGDRGWGCAANVWIESFR